MLRLGSHCAYRFFVIRVERIGHHPNPNTVAGEESDLFVGQHGAGADTHHHSLARKLCRCLQTEESQLQLEWSRRERMVQR